MLGGLRDSRIVIGVKKKMVRVNVTRTEAMSICVCEFERCVLQCAFERSNVFCVVGQSLKGN